MSAPHGYNSVVRRVLEIPEILDIIFSFLDSASNTQNALVCKKWSDPSLSNVWRIVTNPHILFSLLAPTKEYRDRAQIIFVSLFTRVIDTAVKKRRYRNSNEEWRSRIGSVLSDTLAKYAVSSLTRAPHRVSSRTPYWTRSPAHAYPFTFSPICATSRGTRSTTSGCGSR